ncbi:ABC transporter permease [Candidatus Pacearchaeota archaeon]|nr:MAG: ABC transporter permease [Candidatus Pacearchaeota archaeon]
MASIRDYLVFVIKNFSRRKLRGMLTIIGIVIGIMAVVTLISLTQGMQDAITYQFEKLGSNRIIISAGGLSLGPLGSELTTSKLEEKDVKAVERILGVEKVLGILIKTSRIDFKKETKYLSVFAVSTDEESIKVLNDVSFFQIEKGRSINSNDRYSADIGKKVSEDVFDKKILVGDSIKIEGREFNVVGVRKKAGTGVHDFVIKISLDDAREIFNKSEEYDMIIVIAKENIDIGKLAEDIKKELRKSRNVEEGEEDFSVQTPEQVVDIFRQILSIIQIILVGIAAISLVIGGVGIMNTMFTSVLERTKEIGIMKAIGAKSSQILVLFLIESGIIGLLGGSIGIVLGLLIGKTVQLIADNFGVVLIPSMSVILIFGALLFSFLVGSISGVFPALQAARLKPIEAIRKY